LLPAAITRSPSPNESPPGKQVFFFEKKKQKTFGRLSRAHPADTRKGIKVFWLFFKKELLAL
jgi:hypothetical protein